MLLLKPKLTPLLENKDKGQVGAQIARTDKSVEQMKWLVEWLVSGDDFVATKFVLAAKSDTWPYQGKNLRIHNSGTAWVALVVMTEQMS